MGKGMLRGWQETKAGRVVGRGRWTGRIGVGRGRWQRGGGDWKGGGEQQGGQQHGREEGGNDEGDNVEREMERGGNGGWDMGRGKWGKRWGWGGGEEGARGREISLMDIMGCLDRHKL